jgi:hypothetical protein
MSFKIRADEKLPRFKNNIVAWQVDRRFRIQCIMHELHRFLAAQESLHSDHNDAWYPMVRMVGIAFSLWRAAFLTHTTGKKKAAYKNMVEYLDKVIKQNTIAFIDDYNMSDHAAPYYTGNARYRLERMYRFNPDLLQIKSVAAIDKLLQDDREEMPQDVLWDMCYLALKDCYLAYMQTWHTRFRPDVKTSDAKPGVDSTEPQP